GQTRHHQTAAVIEADDSHFFRHTNIANFQFVEQLLSQPITGGHNRVKSPLWMIEQLLNTHAEIGIPAMENRRNQLGIIGDPIIRKDIPVSPVAFFSIKEIGAAQKSN